MIADAILQIALYLIMLLGLSWPLGILIANLFERSNPSTPLNRLEVMLFRLLRVRHEEEMSWIEYAKNNLNIHLTPIEYKLLHLLLRHADKVLTHKQILNEVWGPSYARQTQYLRVFMGSLRHKL